MPLFVLKPNDYTWIEFKIRRSRRAVVHYLVEAEEAIAVYIVDEDGLDDYRAGENFDFYIGHGRRKYHEEKYHLLPGTYYLLIYSNSKKPIAVRFEFL